MTRRGYGPAASLMSAPGAGGTIAARDGFARPSALSAWAERHVGWLLAAPAVLLILALTLYPLGYSLWVSFVNYDFLVPGHAFVGLRNFAQVVADPIARTALLTTVVLSVADVAIEFALGLGLALLLERPLAGRGLVTSVLIIPLFISPVIVGQFWALLLQRPFGPVDYLLSQLLGHPVTINWLSEFPWNFIALILADVWQWTPFMFVIMLAGLTALPAEPYEAALIDGVNGWQAFRYITLPQLVPMILLAVTFRLLDAVKLFDIIFMMTGGGPGTSTYTASFFLYEMGFQHFHLSEATAGSWIFLILTAAAITALVRRLLRAGAEA
ncbi:MAG: sugar ABC transporter permease [Acetobacteraceae bacterium]|nr:sugar ABC transporter permease [Acetobacteraceae bacterium]